MDDHQEWGKGEGEGQGKGGDKKGQKGGKGKPVYTKEELKEDQRRSERSNGECGTVNRCK